MEVSIDHSSALPYENETAFALRILPKISRVQMLTRDLLCSQVQLPQKEI